MATAFSQRGGAGTAAEASVNPLASLSQPLLLAQRDALPTVVDWAQPNGLDFLSPAYLQLLKTKRAFAVGGLRLVVDCGLVVDWYNDDATRRDALNLIDSRGARPLLDRLADKDQPTSIFGKNDLRAFFKTFPPVRRNITQTQAGGPTSARQVRKDHPLRLRKVLEFLFLTEAVLRFRFRSNETKSRFEGVTGVKVVNEDAALRLWGYMW